MSTDPRLEHYLAKLERVLTPFSTSDRAEIVMEIKSHVLAALERDPNASMDSILSALGEPETVANRYLMERGMKPTKPSFSPVVKWLVLGFLGTMAIGMCFVGLLLFKFSPILEVDENKDHVSILGGLIDISGKEGTVRVGRSLHFGGKSKSVSGTFPIKTPTETFDVKFKNGKVELRNSDEAKVSWECRIDEKATPPSPTTDSHGTALDFTNTSGVKCEIEIPQNLHFGLAGANGKVKVDEPHFHLDMELANGKVEISPDEEKKYAYNLSVQNGSTDTFESSKEPSSYQIKVRLTNGKIDRAN